MLMTPTPTPASSHGKARVQRGSLGLHFQEKVQAEGLRSQQERIGRFGSPGHNLLLKTMYQKITRLMGYLEPRSGRAEVDLFVF